jgi:GNAT superfamily N-acetyltransferase
MKITDFTAAHIEQAMHIAKLNYEKEREFVPSLPPIDTVPDLARYAENGLGVAAFEGDAMIGYLCCLHPFKNAFRSTYATGVFSPMEANGAIGENRAEAYARLYQAAAEKWVRAGASSHAVCLYAHDREVQEQFYRYGFGIRCIDAIRGMDDIPEPLCEGYNFFELDPESVLKVLPLENMLNDSYLDSPFFMYRERSSESGFLEEYGICKSIYFVAEHEGQIVAFIRAELDGETFIQHTPGYLHVRGTYCLPEHRGKGVNKKLLSLLVKKLRQKGYTRLGVDFESFNPSGSGFWFKYFDPYTHSVVRRIDEKAVEIKTSRQVDDFN